MRGKNINHCSPPWAPKQFGGEGRGDVFGAGYGQTNRGARDLTARLFRVKRRQDDGTIVDKPESLKIVKRLARGVKVKFYTATAVFFVYQEVK